MDWVNNHTILQNGFRSYNPHFPVGGLFVLTGYGFEIREPKDLLYNSTLLPNKLKKPPNN